MKDFLTIGSVTVDLFLKDEMFFGDTLSNIEIGSKYDMDDYFVRMGGSAYNTSKLFSNFGYKTNLMSCVSKGYYGKMFYQAIKKQKNLSTKSLQVISKIKTSFSVILLSLTKERIILKYNSFKYGFVFNKNKLKGFKVICLSSLNGREDILKGVFEFKKNHNVFLTDNPGKKDFDFLKKNLDYLKLLDVLVMNKEEASKFSGVDKIEINHLLDYFAEKVGGVFIMTNGKEGSFVCTGGKRYQCGVYEDQKLEDMTGAGDAFYSGFVMEYYMHRDLEMSLRLACANAYEVVGEIGSSKNTLTPGKYMSKE